MLPVMSQIAELTDTLKEVGGRLEKAIAEAKDFYGLPGQDIYLLPHLLEEPIVAPSPKKEAAQLRQYPDLNLPYVEKLLVVPLAEMDKPRPQRIRHWRLYPHILTYYSGDFIFQRGNFGGLINPFGEPASFNVRDYFVTGGFFFAHTEQLRVTIMRHIVVVDDFREDNWRTREFLALRNHALMRETTYDNDGIKHSEPTFVTCEDKFLSEALRELYGSPFLIYKRAGENAKASLTLPQPAGKPDLCHSLL